MQCLGSHRPPRTPSHLDLGSLYAQRHNGVYDVVVVLLKGLDGLLSGDAGLLHDKLNVLALEARVVNLFVIVLLFLLLLVLGSFALALAGLVAVVVAGVVVGVSLGLGELLGGGSLGLGVQVLDLGLTEDAGAGSVGGTAMEG